MLVETKDGDRQAFEKKNRDPAQSAGAGAGAGVPSGAITPISAPGAGTSAGAGPAGMIRLLDYWLRSVISTASGILRPVPGKTSNLAYPDHRIAFIRAAKDAVPPRELPEVGEITAFRCWKLSCGHLWSIATAHRWEPDEPMTGDLGDIFFAEGAVFGGVYAWREPEDAVRHAREMWGRHWLDLPPVPEALVVGRVALWGEIDEHERGYRAENARIGGLDAIIADRPFPATWFAALAERYRVRS